MPDPFVHLHVASGYSLRHGASPPATVVERAADHGMDTLALTDRDGVYGAVKFVTACMAHGVRPVLGTDLAVAPYDDQPVVPSTRRRTPARGGVFVDQRLPRGTVVARDKAGWGAAGGSGRGVRPPPAGISTGGGTRSSTAASSRTTSSSRSSVIAGPVTRP